jgi:hypothetical protein
LMDHGRSGKMPLIEGSRGAPVRREVQLVWTWSEEMPYAPFYERFLEVAKRETRTITVTRWANLDLPPRDYTFLELFCDEPDCDCRRVFFHVMSSPGGEPDAVIAYGWESRDFYAKWMGDEDELALRELKGPALNLCSPQSKRAPALLSLFQSVLLKDVEYMERVKRHYLMFREAINRKAKGARRTKRFLSRGKDS